MYTVLQWKLKIDPWTRETGEFVAWHHFSHHMSEFTLAQKDKQVAWRDNGTSQGNAETEDTVLMRGRGVRNRENEFQLYLHELIGI